jgi:hypothetical protein
VHPRRSVVSNPAAPPAREAPRHQRPAGRALPHGYGRHSLRPPHRLPVESHPQGVRVGLHLPPAVPAVGPGGRLPAPLGPGAPGVRSTPRDRWRWQALDSVMVKAPLGGRKPAPILRIAASSAPNATR